MELTRTPIDAVLRTGRAEHSPLAARFIEAAGTRLGLAVEACYVQTTPHILTVCLHGGRSAGQADADQIGALFAQLAGTVQPAVTLNYIDRLALWHLLADLLPMLNRLDAVRAVGGRVWCGWDESRQAMAPWVTVSSVCLTTLDRAAFSAQFAAEAFPRLKRRDKWDAITPAALVPIVTTWDALSDAQKFAFLRG